MIPLGNDGNFDADETSLFTGVLYNFYSPPPGFCFDLLCNDEPIKDDPDLEDYNVDKRKGFWTLLAFNLIETEFLEYITQAYFETNWADFLYLT